MCEVEVGLSEVGLPLTAFLNVRPFARKMAWHCPIQVNNIVLPPSTPNHSTTAPKPRQISSYQPHRCLEIIDTESPLVISRCSIARALTTVVCRYKMKCGTRCVHHQTTTHEKAPQSTPKDSTNSRHEDSPRGRRDRQTRRGNDPILLIHQ